MTQHMENLEDEKLKKKSFHSAFLGWPEVTFTSRCPKEEVWNLTLSTDNQ